MPVPLFDPQSPSRPLRAQIDGALARVLDDGRFILGPEVEAFEHELAAWLDAPHAIVANGTEAITIALRALGVGSGDEVVVPSFTLYASAEAIPPTGASPVFCEVDADTCCATAETVRAALTPRTKAVVAVDLFGNVAPVAEIEALGVPVVEDAAQAAGAVAAGDRRAGTLGTLATFSFYPSKNLGAFGDGDAIVTGNAALAEGVQSRGYYRTPVHRQEAMRPWAPAIALPVTDELARTHLALPMGASLTRADIAVVGAAFRRAAG